MGETKNRDNDDEKKSKTLNVRVTKRVKDILVRKGRGKSVSEKVFRILEKHCKKLEKPKKDYCENCGKEIKDLTIFYCLNAELMRFEGEDIEIISSAPLKVLCMACARKTGKLKDFDDD